MRRIKHKLYHRKNRQKNNMNKKSIYIFRNRVNRELKRAKQNYYTRYFEENSKNVKRTWNSMEGLKSIINHKTQKSYNITNQIR